MCVDDMLMFTRETDQSDTALLRKPNGECRGRRHRSDKTYADAGSLLHHLVARAAGNQQPAIGNVQVAAHHGANHFVERVVPAHVFANDLYPLARQDPGCRMDTAGLRIDGLMTTD